MASWLSEGISKTWVMLMLVNIFLFLISAVMDEIAVMVIVGPLLIALAQKFGIDPIHFGSIIVTNVAIATTSARPNMALENSQDGSAYALNVTAFRGASAPISTMPPYIGLTLICRAG